MTQHSGTHTESENDPWTIEVGDHPDRSDSPQYRRSRTLMIKLVQTTQPWLLGDKPYQDHHGGGIWVKDNSGWLLVLGLAGIEWSAQFCADPVKVDQLRLQAQRIVGGFPDTIAEYAKLGYPDAAKLLNAAIIDADSIADWTDGIFNASVPLPADRHTGQLPKGGGYHHYPKPIVDIELFKHDDFELFVTTDDGEQIAVTPVSRRGSGDGRVALAWSPATAVGTSADASDPQHQRTIFAPDSSPAQQAFARQR